jgi:Ni,Fe-hydrogenase I cytochrome b subunit
MVPQGEVFAITPQINVWADLLAIVLTAAIFLIWTAKITGDVLSGRFRKKFIEGQWPAHDEVIPPLPKILHLTHVISMIALGFSGLYIRYPFFQGGRTPMRYLHYVAMYVVTINMIYRIYYAYMVDGKEFIITKQEIKNVPSVLLYYTYFKDHYPHLAKYNPMQKSTYGIFFPIFMILQAFTGFSLVWPNLLLPWASGIAGGLANAIAYARITHFLIAMVLITLTGVHAVLAVMEGFPSFLDFFFLAKPHAHEEKEHEPEPPKKRRKKKLAPALQGEVEVSAAGHDLTVEAVSHVGPTEPQTKRKTELQAEPDQGTGDV